MQRKWLLIKEKIGFFWAVILLQLTELNIVNLRFASAPRRMIILVNTTPFQFQHSIEEFLNKIMQLLLLVIYEN